MFHIQTIIDRVEKHDNTKGSEETDSFHKMIIDTPSEYRQELVAYILTVRSRPSHLAPSLAKSIYNAAVIDKIKAECC